MKAPELTPSGSTLYDHNMIGDGNDGGGAGSAQAGWRRLAQLALIGVMGLLAGCVTVAAPDKPIVIELNVNIKQTVVYRLAADTQQTIEQNGDVF